MYQNEPQADVGEDLASTIALAAAGRHVETIDLYKADNSSLGFSVVSAMLSKFYPYIVYILNSDLYTGCLMPESA